MAEDEELSHTGRILPPIAPTLSGVNFPLNLVKREARLKIFVNQQRQLVSCYSSYTIIHQIWHADAVLFTLIELIYVAS